MTVRRTVLPTGLALLALWGASFGLSYAPLGGAALPVALGIAGVKAGLVGLFFMELAREKGSIRLTVAAALALAGVLVAFMVADVLTR
jgi:cytochrome c oxidase subunit 4